MADWFCSMPHKLDGMAQAAKVCIQSWDDCFDAHMNMFAVSAREPQHIGAILQEQMHSSAKRDRGGQKGTELAEGDDEVRG